jgi:lipopolysaccharide transport system permease protein
MVARIPTDGAPQLLFYLPGIVLWNFFSTSFLKSSSTLVANTHIFGKVYFPRLVLPVSGLIASMVNFGIQFLLFITIFLFYYSTGAKVNPSGWILLFPALLLIISCYSLGLGLIVSSLTIRYRDLTHFLSFGVQLLMYATPIIYPSSIIPAAYKWVSYVNPLSPLFEAFRYAFLGNGLLDLPHIFMSFCAGLIVLFIGLVMFNQAQRTAIDTV